ncbi:MAG: hypothetical protein HYV34_04285, partial [Candidatus Kerfeldbacteria bacterium]|nr:hypothetical protein [Candidatus Kerfeldbacteria bacterium]
SLVFRQFTPLYYTIDFLFDRNDKPWVVEINCRPGIKFPAGFHGDPAQVWQTFGRFFLTEYAKWKGKRV